MLISCSSSRRRSHPTPCPSWVCRLRSRRSRKPNARTPSRSGGTAGSGGSGKTYSALRLARGLAGDRGRVALIDTEAGRALHYAERFDFDHCDLKPPFAPSAYADAIAAAEGAGDPGIVGDSLSHEWAGGI